MRIALNVWSIAAIAAGVPAVASAAITPVDSYWFANKYEMNVVGDGVDPAGNTSQNNRGAGGTFSASLGSGFLEYNSVGAVGNGIYWLE